MYKELSQELEILSEFSAVDFDNLTPEEIEEIENKIIESHTNSIESIGRTLNFLDFLDSQVERAKKSIDRIQKQKRYAENLNRRLKNAITGYLIETGNPKTQIGDYKLSLRKSESVKIYDEDLIPEQLKETVVTVKISKSNLKKAIKEGFEVKGAEIVTNFNLQIK